MLLKKKLIVKAFIIIKENLKTERDKKKVSIPKKVLKILSNLWL